MINKGEVRDNSSKKKLSYDVELYEKQFMEKHLKFINDYKLTTDNYNKIIEKFNNLRNNRKPFLLNDDCIFYILTFLDAFDVVKCSLINKKFYKISRSELLWEGLFNNVFYNLDADAEIKNFCNYKNCNILNNFMLKYINYSVNDLYFAEYIDFNDTDMYQLPPEIGLLDNVVQLDLCNNKNLSIIPDGIWGLSNLSMINWNNNNISIIPPEIGLLELEFITLFNNNLSSIPKEFGHLIYLQTLNLRDNKLTSIPSEFGQLINLSSLNLKRNKLQSIPREFGLLTNLNTLDLSYNELEIIPSEIGNSINLTKLKISHNKLKKIPKTIGQLTNLQKLCLDDNCLKSIPKEVEYLDNFVELVLNNNNGNKYWKYKYINIY